MKHMTGESYDPKTLKKVQQTELEILHDFVELCEKNNLVYFGVAGTGIGAIRHGGFIPWDDDIDVAMPRKDFDEFVKIAKEAYSDKYIVLNCEEYPNYPLMTTRWVKKGTKFVEWPLKGVDCPLGIFLDIYPLDNIPDDEKEFRKQSAATFIYAKLLILRSIAFPVLGFKGIKASVVHGICGLIHLLLCFFRVSKKWLYRNCLRWCTKYNDRVTGRVDFLCDTTAYLNIHEIEGMYPLRKIKFEDIQLNFPGNIEQNLTKSYGDFMKLPPEGKRKNHLPYELQFSDEPAATDQVPVK